MAVTDTRRLRLLAPTWMDHIFGTGAVGELEIGETMFMDLLRAIDASPVTRGYGLQIGVVGRAKGMEQPVRATKFIRAPDMNHKTSVIVYIGPELSKPPTAPDVSTTHKMIAELFSTTLTCSLAVAALAASMMTGAAAEWRMRGAHWAAFHAYNRVAEERPKAPVKR